ncbi:MAG TPA: transaldolase family protein [Gemmatimonadaceae bacterium]|nr:transaldolase family protein [Gemmatimonadaceae bacterium]
MKILLATASPDDVRWAHENGLIDGVVTTPGLLAAADDGRGWQAQLGELAHVAAGPVFAAVGAIDGRDIYREGRELAKVSDQLVLQIPMVEDAIVAVRKLSADGVRVAATLVFTAAQAVLAAKAGASMIAVDLAVLDAVGAHGVDVVREVRAVLDADGTGCDVVAMMPRDATQFADCVMAGADTLVVSTGVLRALLVHPLTDRGVDQLLNELSKQPRVRAP